MPTRYGIIAAALLLLLLVGTLPAQEKKGGDEKRGSIEQFEDELENEGRHERRDRDDDDHDDDHDDADVVIVHHYHGGFGDFFAALAAEAAVHSFVGAFFWIPNEDTLFYGGDIWRLGYTPYPYYRSNVGSFDPEGGQRHRVDVSGHWFYGGGDLDGRGLRARLALSPFIAVDGSWTDLQERVASGSDAARYDNIRFYSAFLNYNRFRFSRLQAWWGLGLMGLDGNRTYTGFAWNLGAELFPVRPLSVSLRYAGGWVADQYLPEWRVALNLHVRRVAVYAGYQRWSVGDAALDGLIAGARVTF